MLYYCWRNFGPPLCYGDERKANQWAAQDEPSSKKAKAIPSAGKPQKIDFRTFISEILLLNTSYQVDYIHLSNSFYNQYS